MSFKSLRSERKYSSDSFQRFGDHLCELLLSYLSVKQKKRFECVSKQWQRFVVKKEQKLSVKSDRFERCFGERDVFENSMNNNNRVYSVFNGFKFINSEHIYDRNRNVFSRNWLRNRSECVSDRHSNKNGFNFGNKTIYDFNEQYLMSESDSDMIDVNEHQSEEMDTN